jgi:hypothetical protein
MAENALISGEVALWKAGQYAQTPKINVMAWMQERTPTVIPSLGYIPKTEKGAPEIKYDFGGETGSRMTYKTVGGKQTSGLRTEPSLKSMGELPGLETGNRGTAQYIRQQDFRGRPLSETMKPMDLSKAQGKQSAIAFQIMTEELPFVEQRSARGRAPAIATGFGFYQTQVPRARVQAEQIFSTGQEQRRKETVAQTMSFEVMQGQRQRQAMSGMAELRYPVLSEGESRKARNREALIQEQLWGAGTTSGSRSGLIPFSTQGLRNITDQTVRQTPRQTARRYLHCLRLRQTAAWRRPPLPPAFSAAWIMASLSRAVVLLT